MKCALHGVHCDGRGNFTALPTADSICHNPKTVGFVKKNTILITFSLSADVGRAGHAYAHKPPQKNIL
jgi:hypothetical protein